MCWLSRKKRYRTGNFHSWPGLAKILIENKLKNLKATLGDS